MDRRRRKKNDAAEATLEDLAQLPSLTPAEFNHFIHNMGKRLDAVVASTTGSGDLAAKAASVMDSVHGSNKSKKAAKPKLDAAISKFCKCIDNIRTEKTQIEDVSSDDLDTKAFMATSVRITAELEAAKTALELEIEGLQFYVKQQAHQKCCQKQREYLGASPSAAEILGRVQGELMERRSGAPERRLWCAETFLGAGGATFVFCSTWCSGSDGL